MSEKFGIPAFERWQEAMAKYDYFVLGLAGAILAYAIQSTDAHTYVRAKFLAPTAWFVLGLSVISGLLRIQAVVTGMSLTYHRMEAGDRIRQIQQMRMASEPEQIPVMLSVTGMRPMSAADLAAEEEKTRRRYDEASKKEARRGHHALIAYRARDILLLLGLGILGVLKALNL
jgi:hypothetical protein